MAKTSIKQTGFNTVELSYDNADGLARVTREFTVPHCGGYVRDASGRQVCRGLSSMGETLYCPDPSSLAEIIRKEWRASRAKILNF